MGGAARGGSRRANSMMMAMTITITMTIWLCSVRGTASVRMLAMEEMDMQRDLMEGQLQGSKYTVPIYIAIAGAAIAAGVALMVAFPVVAVCIVQALGFTAQGIAAGSQAALMMSLYAGQVAAGSLVAICQSVGALGIAGVCACGPIVAVGIIISLCLLALGGGLYALLHAHHAADGSGSETLRYYWTQFCSALDIKEFASTVLAHVRSLFSS